MSIECKEIVRFTKIKVMHDMRTITLKHLMKEMPDIEEFKIELDAFLYALEERIREPDLDFCAVIMAYAREVRKTWLSVVEESIKDRLAEG